MLLDRLLGPRRPALSSMGGGGYVLPFSPNYSLFGRRQSGAGIRVDEYSAMSLSAVFAAVNTLSSIIATLPLCVYRCTKGKRQPAENHPAHGILSIQFNEEMTAAVGRRTLGFHKRLWGNAYGEIQWDGAGRPAAVWPILPWRCYPMRDENKRLYYLVDGTKRVYPEDMIHHTLVSEDGIMGRSFVDYAISSLGLSIAAQEFCEKFFGNGARPGGILQHEGTPTKEQREEQRESWQRSHGGPLNAHRTAVVWGGWKYISDSGSMSPEDTQLLETRRFSTEEVARWLNVPPHILRDLSRATNNNIEQQALEFIQYSLGPELVFEEQEYDRKLLSPPALYSKHSLAGLLRGDSKARADWAARMFQSGFLNVNEVRDTENLNSIGPDGDVYFVPVNVQPINKATTAPAKQPSPGPAPGPGPGEERDPADPESPDQSKMRAAIEAMLTGTFGRLMRKELNEARRAAKKPAEFLSWLDAFYPEFEATLTEALAGPMTARNALAGVDWIGDKAAAVEYCQRSREALLRVAGEAKAAELPAAVDREFAEWESRPAVEAARLFGVNDV